jgi:hypothetical protein
MFFSNQNPFEFVFPVSFFVQIAAPCNGKFPMRQTRALSVCSTAETLKRGP